MIRKVSILLFAGLIFSTGFAQIDSIDVLFLGNSYTYVNSLPDLCRNLAHSGGKMLHFDDNTPGGYTLEEHAADVTSLSKIREGHWDYVVLQEQSQIPTIDFYRYGSMIPAAKKLRDTIEKYNPCAQVVMYMTWGRQFGGQQCDAPPTHCSPAFTDFSHMQDSLESAYEAVGDSIDAFVSPVGMAWKAVLEDTNMILHSADQSHPAFNGSYLAGCVFHGVFWNESPKGLPFQGTLSSAEAAYFQNVADSTVFHATSDWNIDHEYIMADFSKVVSNRQVQFTNLSQSAVALNYLWDFGDGLTSTAMSPVHTFPHTGTFHVVLTAWHCNDFSVSEADVEIITTNVEEMQSLKQRISPNPSHGNLAINFGDRVSGSLKCFDSGGRLKEHWRIQDCQNWHGDLSNLSTGLYIIQFQEDDGSGWVERLMRN